MGEDKWYLITIGVESWRFSPAVMLDYASQDWHAAIISYLGIFIAIYSVI